MAARVKITDPTTGLDIGLPGARPFAVSSVQSGNGFPANAAGVAATPQRSTSGLVANAVAVATLAAVPGQTTYITGFTVTGGGATVGQTVAALVTQLFGGPITYAYTAETGVGVGSRPLNVTFTPPYPATGPNTPIIVTVAAVGAGNLATCVTAIGFTL